MEALYKGEEFVSTHASESVVNILVRYSDIEDLFSDEIKGEVLPYFVDWLIENVHLVEITAYSDSDAYTIFETMNDRGLSLAPADMLKGYLLAHITDVERRTRANQAWKARTQALADIGKDEDADGIKSWLRSQYAESIRERKRGAAPQDFDLIGTEFHRWVRDHEAELGLTASAEFGRFIERDFAYYAGWYERLRGAAEKLTPGLECIRFNADHNFTLQYPVLPTARGGRRTRGETKASHSSGLPRHTHPSAHLELACDRLLHNAVCNVPRDARHPRKEWARVGYDPVPKVGYRIRNLLQQ